MAPWPAPKVVLLPEHLLEPHSATIACLQLASFSAHLLLAPPRPWFTTCARVMPRPSHSQLACLCRLARRAGKEHPQCRLTPVSRHPQLCPLIKLVRLHITSTRPWVHACLHVSCQHPICCTPMCRLSLSACLVHPTPFRLIASMLLQQKKQS
jgi:hypothetical protein